MNSATDLLHTKPGGNIHRFWTSCDRTLTLKVDLIDIFKFEMLNPFYFAENVERYILWREN